MRPILVFTAFRMYPIASNGAAGDSLRSNLTIYLVWPHELSLFLVSSSHSSPSPRHSFERIHIAHYNITLSSRRLQRPACTPHAADRSSSFWHLKLVTNYIREERFFPALYLWFISTSNIAHPGPTSFISLVRQCHQVHHCRNPAPHKYWCNMVAILIEPSCYASPAFKGFSSQVFGNVIYHGSQWSLALPGPLRDQLSSHQSFY